MLAPIILIVVSALAAASYIVTKRPDAKAALDKLTPFQGIIGVLAGLLGLWWTFDLLRHISLMSAAPMYYLLGLAVALLMVALGFLMGYGLIAKYALSKNAEAAARGEAMRMKLVKFQTPLGLAGIVVGVIGIIMAVVR
jgi:hypothetical protein